MPLIDLADVVRVNQTGTYRVRRAARESWVKGKGVRGAEQLLDVPGVLSPATPAQLERLEEGMRSNAVISLISETELRTETDAGPPDVIEHDGWDWEVQSVADWEQLGGFFVALAARERKTGT